MVEFKFLWVILHTAGITAEQLKAARDNPFGEASDEDIENWLKAYQAADGAKVLVTENKRANGKTEYTLMGWDDDSAEMMKMFYYYCEQDSLFGCYQDDFERFDSEWKAKEYESDGCMVFDSENVEIVEELKHPAENEQ